MIAIAVGMAKNVGRTIALVSATLNDAAPPEKRESRLGRACRLSDCGEAMDREAFAEIKLDVLTPDSVRSTLIFEVWSL